MSEYRKTTDLALGYQLTPRLNESFYVDENSFVDLMLPHEGTERARLRLYDMNERWVRAVDLSQFYSRIPDSDEVRFLDAPHGAYDTFDLGEEFFIGRDHNPDNLPILNKNVVSRNHVGVTLALGQRGLLLTLRDQSSHNGTELVMNATLTPVEKDSLLLAG